MVLGRLQIVLGRFSSFLTLVSTFLDSYSIENYTQFRSYHY